jgi:gliding motility-associated-like protein
MNENAKDASGNGNDGVINGTTNAPDRYNSSNNAVYFNGTSDYIFVPNKNILNPTSGITIAAWVKPRNYIGAGNDPIVNKPYYNHSSPYYQYHLAICGNYGVSPYSFGFNLSIKNQYLGVNSKPIKWIENQWYLVVGTYDGIKMRIYVNGQPGDSLNSPGTIDSYNTDLFIARYGNTGEGTPVTIDDIKIYNRGLSSQEIIKLYESEKPGSINLILSHQGNCSGGKIIFNYTGFNAFDSVLWSFEDGMTSKLNSPSRIFTRPGQYQMSLTGYYHGQKFSQSNQFTITDAPLVRLGNDTTICPGKVIILNAGSTDASFVWNTGLVGNNIPINKPGTYHVTATNACGTSKDTINISYSEFAQVWVTTDTTVCRNLLSKISAKGPSLYQFIWNNSYEGKEFELQPTANQTLDLVVVNEHNCQKSFTTLINVKDCFKEIIIPNVFTPNGDGKNDFWVIDNLDKYPTALVEVFNRWGDVVYRSKGYVTPWDGYFNGKRLSPGCYYYNIILNTGHEAFKGPLMIYQ